MSDAKEIRDLMARCARLERQVAKLPTRIGNSAGGSGTGIASDWYLAESKDQLPAASSVPITAMARITAGDQKGSVLIVSADETNWVSINIFE